MLNLANPMLWPNMADEVKVLAHRSDDLADGQLSQESREGRTTAVTGSGY